MAQRKRSGAEKAAELNLIERAQQGDAEATEQLISNYEPMVGSLVVGYSAPGLETDDLFLIGKIGVWQAIGRFNPDRGYSFATLVHTIVINRVFETIKMANRQLHGHLNSAVGIDDLQHDLGADIPSDKCRAMGDSRWDPAKVLEEKLDREALLRLIDKMRLSELEMQIMLCKLHGLGQQETAARLRVNSKCVDNAIRRIKLKASRVATEES